MIVCGSDDDFMFDDETAITVIATATATAIDSYHI